jgi:putative DNA primase/helicase
VVLRHDRAGIPNDIAKLAGKRFVTASESGEVRLNEARVKALTGRDPVTARFMRAEFFTFVPVAKFWLATNAKPIVHDPSLGFWRRLHLVPFTQSFAGREDKTLKDRLRAEAPGILAWAVRGAIAWQRDGLRPPRAVTAATEGYREESDQLARFIEARMETGDGHRVQARAALDAYRSWCESRRERPALNQKTFHAEMRKRFTADDSNQRATFYVGVGLRATEVMW